MATTKTILIVEDDRFLRKACEASLSQRGFAVITATDGAEGLAMAQLHHPAVILLDLLMPRMPGIEVLRALKSDEATAAIPVLILSNSSRQEDKTTAMAMGAAGYYVKANLSLRDLAATIATLTDGNVGTNSPS